ncbi:anti-sigma factor [Halobacillus rhizosphaerae]|uniref:anti-sigma factor n=1 Tax=Halobacillus rhizosphaerae TaxID=3064889 RepID=UPI00398A6AE9
MMRNECEKVVDYFNGQLNEQEKKEFERHLETCEECREELEELEMLTADLPFASEPVEPPENMKQRVLDAVFADDDSSEDHHLSEASSDDTGNSNLIGMKERREQYRSPIDTGKPSAGKKPWVMGGLAAALVISVGGNIFAIVNDNGETTSQPKVEQPADESTNQVAERVQLKGEKTEAIASAAMIQQDNQNLLTLQAEGLEKLQGDEVYQVWLIKGDKPYRAGTFVANSNGEGAVAFSLDQLPKDTSWDAMAISKEPDATSETPQGEVILSSKL